MVHPTMGTFSSGSHKPDQLHSYKCGLRGCLPTGVKTEICILCTVSSEHLSSVTLNVGCSRENWFSVLMVRSVSQRSFIRRAKPIDLYAEIISDRIFLFQRQGILNTATSRPDNCHLGQSPLRTDCFMNNCN